MDQKITSSLEMGLGVTEYLAWGPLVVLENIDF